MSSDREQPPAPAGGWWQDEKGKWQQGPRATEQPAGFQRAERVSAEGAAPPDDELTSESDPERLVEQLAKRKLSSRVGVRKELKRLADQLEHDEELVTMASGSFEGGSGLLVATDRRLIWTEQGTFKNKVEEFPFDRVATVSTEKKMMSGTLKISVSGGGRHEIKNVMPKERVEEIAGYVRRRISSAPPTPAPQRIAPEPAPTESAPPPPPSPTNDEIVARLSALKDLNEKGLITDEEYAAKRAELVGLL